MEEDNEIAGLPRGAGLALPGEARPFEVTAPDGVPIAAQSWGDPGSPRSCSCTASANAI